MNDRKFSLKAEHVLRCAQAAAGELGHGYVGCEHLLLAMLREEDDAACRALNASGVYEPAVRERMIEKLGRGTAERFDRAGAHPARALRGRAGRRRGDARGQRRDRGGTPAARHPARQRQYGRAAAAIAGCGYQKAVQRHAARDEPVAAPSSRCQRCVQAARRRKTARRSWNSRAI